MLALALSGCSSARALHLEGSGAFFPRGPEARHLAELVRELEPKVVALLGTRYEGSFAVEVGEVAVGRAQTTVGARDVTISPAALDQNLRRTVAHELVHVHARGLWEGLPCAVEEGLAYWVASLAVGEVVSCELPEPSAATLRMALTMTDDQYLRLPASLRAQVNQAGAWLASRLMRPSGVCASVVESGR